MGILEGLIAAVSPRWAYEREAWRQSYQVLRHFDAAGQGRISGHWAAINESAETTDRYSRDIIRARARDLERNSDILQSVILAYDRNVVGKGYTLRANTGDSTLDRRLEELWRQWCEAEKLRRHRGAVFHGTAADGRGAEKGGRRDFVLFRHTAGGLVPFKLQAIDVDELDSGRTQPRRKGNRVVGGVEYNSWRRPQGYWIQQYDIEGGGSWSRSTSTPGTPLFLKSKRRPSQLREMSDLTHTLTRIRDVNEYINAVSVKERIAACMAVFIRKALPSGGFGRSAVQTGDSGRIDYAGKKLTPGMIMELNPGDSVDAVNPAAPPPTPPPSCGPSRLWWGRGRASANEAVSRDMKGSTYSSARQNAVEDEYTYAADIELLQRMMSEIYEQFVISCDLAGLIAPAGFWEDKKKYMAHSWVKAPKKWIDPAKEAGAGQTALQSGQKTYQDVCAERGKDWRQAIEETAEVLAYGREHGVDMGGVLFGSKQQPWPLTRTRNSPGRMTAPVPWARSWLGRGGGRTAAGGSSAFPAREPVDRYFGPEILDHSGDAVNLQRLNEIGVLLFNHDTDKVVGRFSGPGWKTAGAWPRWSLTPTPQPRRCSRRSGPAP